MTFRNADRTRAGDHSWFVSAAGLGARDRLSSRVARLILVAPVVLILIDFVILILPPTRPFGRWLEQENSPVEILTFMAFAAAGIGAIALAARLRRRLEPTLVPAFYVLAGLLYLLIAMEEIAWGQWFFDFSTPDLIARNNLQGEMTLHNIEQLHNHGNLFKLALALCGLAGIWLNRVEACRRIAVSRLLILWFGVVVVHSLLDIYRVSMPVWYGLDQLIKLSRETIELLIGTAMLLYVWLNARMLQATWRPGGARPGTP